MASCYPTLRSNFMAGERTSLEATLMEVSRLCLRGQPVPAALRLLWEAQFAGERLLASCDSDATLSTEMADAARALDVLAIDDTTEPATRRACERLFREVAFLGYGGGAPVLLFGYWLFDGAVSFETAPILDIDSEGQIGTAPTLQDYVLNGAYWQVPESVPALRRRFEERGIATLPSLQAIEDAASWLPNPNQRWERYYREAAEQVVAADRPRE